MGNVTKSQPSTILSPNGNSLAVFVDGITGIIKLKDVQGNIEPLSNYNPNSLYGSFYDTTTQIALGNNTPTPMTYNTTDFSNGISIVNNTVHLNANSEMKTCSNGACSDCNFFIENSKVVACKCETNGSISNHCTYKINDGNYFFTLVSKIIEE